LNVGLMSVLIGTSVTALALAIALAYMCVKVSAERPTYAHVCSITVRTYGRHCTPASSMRTWSHTHEMNKRMSRDPRSASRSS
jgi:hypothetical protein